MVRDYNKLIFESPEFNDGDDIPHDYTCEGNGVSPPFKIQGVPGNAESLVLIMEDLDSDEEGNTTHWIVWNIPPNVTVIEENILPEGSIEGKNDLGAEFYAPPCPDLGVHNYRFVLYAIDKKVDLGPESTRTELEEEIEGHILAESSIEVVFKRNDELEEEFDFDDLDDEY